jgi:tryptophan-rich sensory protein
MNYVYFFSATNDVVIHLHINAHCFSSLQLRKQYGAVLKQPHFELIRMQLYPVWIFLPSSAALSVGLLFSHTCARFSAAHHEETVLYVHDASCERRQRERSLTTSKGLS